VEIGKCCGMEMKVEITKVKRMMRWPTPVLIRTDQKQLDNVE